jgi:CubicO group peptidase (beta-lactamase class C family)
VTRLLALAALTAATTAFAATPASGDAERLGRRLDEWVKPAVQANLLSGSLLVAHRDQVVLERSWGWADAERKIKNTPETRFCIASINKPMTVILALQLMEERKLGYTDTLSKWIAGFSKGDSITVEHLLRHRAGIPHRVTEDKDEIVPHSAADMVEFAKQAKLEFSPGSRYSYSSGGFSVLARVLELASGKPYGELIAERLFQPLGMTRSYHPYQHADTSNGALNYLPVLGGVERAPYENYSFLVGAGGVWSTPRDLHKLMWADASGALGYTARQSALRGKLIAWNGSTNGYRAFAEFDTTTEYSVVFTGNLHSGAVDEMKAAVLALLEGREPAAPSRMPAKAASVPANVLARYEGRYNIANNPALAVKATKSGLDVNSWTLVATSDTSFFSLRDFGTVTAARDSLGKFTGFNWSVAGQSFACPRVGDLEKK